MCYNGCILDNIYGGNNSIYINKFWLFGHPEVYVIIIPCFSIISVYIMINSIWIIYGSTCMVMVFICITIYGNIVWIHHMYTIGMDI